MANIAFIATVQVFDRLGNGFAFSMLVHSENSVASWWASQLAKRKPEERARIILVNTEHVEPALVPVLRALYKESQESGIEQGLKGASKE